MAVEWSGTLISGNVIIDFQHKLALSTIKKLMAEFERGGDDNLLREGICFFDCYILEHFGDEELLQKKHNYPKCEEHKAEHEAMIHDFEKYKKRVETEGYSRALTAEALAILSIWLRKHLLEADRDFILFLRKFYPIDKYEEKPQSA